VGRSSREGDKIIEEEAEMKIYENREFQGCIDVVLDTTDMYKDINYQRMSNNELQDFIMQTLEMQKQVQATLLAMRYIQGTRDERRSWKTTTQDMRYKK
jgi:hypothetical protein